MYILRRLAVRATLARLLLGCASVMAMTMPIRTEAQQAEPAGPPGWIFSITPYLWMSAISGTLDTKRGGDASFDQSFGDVLNKLHGMPFMGTAEAQYGRFSIIGDILYLPVGVELHPRQGAFVTGSVNINTTIGTTAGFYRVVQTGENSIDIGGGVRAYGVSNMLSLRNQRGSRSFSTWSAWADPLIALRAHTDFGGGLGASFYGDVGGFGAGSKLSWQIIGSLDYQLTAAIALRVGYRYLAVNLEHQRDITFDMQIGGPFLAATFRF